MTKRHWLWSLIVSFFFFSSRRRHTRYWRDWSSDVCSSDLFIPPSNMSTLAAAARTAPDADVQTWLVKGANHAQSYNKMGKAYVDRIVTFYTGALGPDTSV